MRYIPANCIRSGMKLARKLMGKNGELYLNKGIAIQESYISKIINLGYAGVYIEDDLSSDIEIIEIINEDLRNKSVQAIKNTFSAIENGSDYIETNIEELSEAVNLIVDSVLDNRDTLVNMLDLKAFDDYTYFHSINVTLLSLVLGASIDLNKYDMHKLGLSAILHDIGKVFVPKSILNKPDRLTNEELEVIQLHPTKGYQYLKRDFDIPIASYIGVLQHHERYNGSGYPLSIEGDKIHIFGRIIAITDVYDALTSNRPYRKAMLPSEAFEYVLANSSIHFDPALVSSFAKKIAAYPVGTVIQLSNGYTGIVAGNYADSALRPKVKVFRYGARNVDPYIIDLKNDNDFLNVTIVGQDIDTAPAT